MPPTVLFVLQNPSYIPLLYLALQDQSQETSRRQKQKAETKFYMNKNDEKLEIPNIMFW